MVVLSRQQFTHNNVCFHSDSFSPSSWKIKALKILPLTLLLTPLFVACFNEQLLNKEIEQLRNVFHHTNGYPKAVIQNVI